MAYWLEKTYPSDRDEKDFTSILLSPVGDTRGHQIYKNMTMVKPSDIIFHLDQDTNSLVGYSYVASQYEKINLDNTEYYTVNLENFHKFETPIDINKVLSSSKNYKKLKEIKDECKNIFFQERANKKGFSLRQGAYLTSVCLKLKKIIIPNSDIIDEFDYTFDTDIYNSDYKKEGKEKYYLHLRKERSKKLVKDAKNIFKQKNNRLFCECCGFDFVQEYGSLGEDFIEAHHIVPIHSLKKEIAPKIQDLLLLCSNCHRMVHRTKNVDISDVKKALKKIKQ